MFGLMASTTSQLVPNRIAAPPPVLAMVPLLTMVKSPLPVTTAAAVAELVVIVPEFVSELAVRSRLMPRPVAVTVPEFVTVTAPLPVEATMPCAAVTDPAWVMVIVPDADVARMPV